ncbi:MAG TPA: HAD hydrolase-like protein, partial [Sphingomicrobium sp.]|nr:HAD hydrolase-like protein [Sphingomicrobium sp.]
MNRLAIFDCDGTLVDSGATIFNAVAETFVEHGIAVPPARECRRVIGLSLTEAMAALVPNASAAEHSALTATYKSKFFQARVEG